MTLISMQKLLAEAEKGGYAVGYFEAWNLESLEAVMDAAEETRSPVILGFGGGFLESPHRLDSPHLELYAALGLAAARTTTVPVCLLLNEISSLEWVEKAIGLGFNAVMLDSPHLPFEENLSITKKVVEMAHRAEVAVEAQLGRLPEGKGDERGGLKTDPALAEEFVEQSGIDALSVSVGNIHLLQEEVAEIDLEHLARISERVRLPLVIHGGSGFPSQAVREAIRLGVRKFNVGTILKESFLEGMRQVSLEAHPQLILGSGTNKDILVAGKMAMKRKVKELLELYGSVGKANGP